MRLFLLCLLLVGLASSRPQGDQTNKEVSTTQKAATTTHKEVSTTSSPQNSTTASASPGNRTRNMSAMFNISSYTTQYDNIDLDEILNNDRLFKKYYRCLIGEGKCTPDGKELKDVLPEALSTNCEKCTTRQKLGGDKVLKFLIEKRPKEWAVLEKMYDPQGIFRKRYKEDYEKRGVMFDVDES